MLDQNTDRTYWMIGAVIVVAILIGVAKVSFPKLFNDVIAKFTSALTAGFAHFPIDSIMSIFS
ncbi:hypothetical protein [Lederbergia lenta]|uniref:hypothetical protein n=1 Tax=Lederbergia lenta TaxID=1467 RepID=UPI0020426B98|nr:hypothetical protein [Lederbergia lenta]MCM3113653.1 hypothetical protein [Lederbergia lenta]